MQEGRSLLTPLLPTFTLINTSQIPGDGSLHDRLKRTFAQTFRLWTICSDKGARKTCDKRLCGSIIYTHAQIPNWQQQMHTHETDLHWCHLITPSLLVTICRKSFSNSVRTRIPQDHGGVIHATVRSPWECLTATLHFNIMSFWCFPPHWIQRKPITLWQPMSVLLMDACSTFQHENVCKIRALLGLLLLEFILHWRMVGHHKWEAPCSQSKPVYESYYSFSINLPE